MALVNPQIAMSYRPTVEYQPRNALAEYAQIQSIVGGQRQAEMADMQMEALRRERDALGQIQAAIVAKGGPPDLEAAADAMIKTGRPEYLTQGMAIRTALRNQREAEAYRRDFGGGAAPANALVAPAAAAAPASQGEPVAAPILPSTVTARDIPPVGGAGAPAPLTQGAAPVAKKPLMQMSPTEKLAQDIAARNQYYEGRKREQDLAQIARLTEDLNKLEPGGTGELSYENRRKFLTDRINELTVRTAPVSANALAPAAAAPVANAMVAPAAVPTAVVPTAAMPVPVAAAAAPDANAIRLRALEAQYRRIGNNPELASEKALVLKQIEDVQATIRAENIKAPETKLMRDLNIPITEAGFAQLQRLKENPGELTRLLDRLNLPPADRRRIELQAVQKLTTHAPPTQLSVTNVREKAEAGEYGKLLVDQYKAISNAATLATKSLPSFETQAKILDDGFTTGFGTGAIKAGASILSALGVPEAEKFASNAETFLAATQNAVLQKQLEQKGTQSTSDAERITQTGAQLGNTVRGNRFIIDVAKAQLQRDIEHRNFYAEWRRGPGKGSFDGAEDAWFSGPGGKSLFDRPELKKYAAPAGAGAGAPAAAPGSVRSQADAILQRK